MEILIFIYILVLLHLSINNLISLNTKIIMILLLYFVLVFNVMYGKKEGFKDNSQRGLLGQFYVDCPSCNKCGKKVFNSNNDFRVNLNEKLQTMSFFNKEYVDTDHIYCYNCLKDMPIYEKNMTLRNYNDFPTVNGPPY